MSNQVGQSISEKKRAANRRNAQLSTGPRTVEGKARVSRNAVKHGLLAQHAVHSGCGNEDDSEFIELLEGLCAHYQPVGLQEDLLVQQIASGYWRQARLQRYEKVVVEGRRLAAPVEESLRQAEQVRVAIAHLPEPQAQIDLLRTSTGVRYLLDVIARLRDELTVAGGMSAAGVERAKNHFGENSTIARAASACVSAVRPSEPESGTGEVPAPTSKDRCEELEGALAQEQRDLERHLPFIQQHEESQTEKNISVSILESDAARLMLRYETTTDRKIARAQSQLERLQRQRRGEFVPPPVRVEIY